MKFSVSIVIVLMVGLLALVPYSSATGYLNSGNWSGIDNIWDSLGMSYLKNSSLLAGANITLTKYANGSVLIASTGAAGGNVSSVTAQSPLTYTGTTDVVIKDERTTYPNSTVAGNLANWNATYNATYAKGGFGFSIENGTNVIETGYSNNLTTVYAGSLVKLIAHSAETGSINVSFWNATAGNTYIDSVVITSGTDGNKTLNYAFSDETRIMYNVTSVSDIKKVMITGKTIKS